MACRSRAASVFTLAYFALVGLPTKGHADLAQAQQLYLAEQWHRALPLMLPQAETGDRQAQFWTGVMLLEGGHGIEPQQETGLSWLERAARAGHTGAAYELYVHYSTAHTNTPNRRVWAEAVARGGATAEGEIHKAQAAMAAADLGRLNLHQQPSEAAFWYKIAGILGDGGATQLGDDLFAELPSSEQTQVTQAIAAWQQGRPWP